MVICLSRSPANTKKDPVADILSMHTSFLIILYARKEGSIQTRVRAPGGILLSKHGRHGLFKPYPNAQRPWACAVRAAGSENSAVLSCKGQKKPSWHGEMKRPSVSATLPRSSRVSLNSLVRSQATSHGSLSFTNAPRMRAASSSLTSACA